MTNYGDPKYAPTFVLDMPFIGNAPGVWEDLRPPNRSCWRLSNDDHTQGTIVHVSWLGFNGIKIKQEGNQLKGEVDAGAEILG